MYTPAIVFPEISDIMSKEEEVSSMLSDLLYTKFKSESNLNTLYYSRKVLNGYCYVPSQYTIWVGRYCRYLCLNDIMNIKMKVGGFVINDNGYTVTIKQNKKIFKVEKNGKYWFMTMTEDDQLKINLKQMMNKI